MCLLLSLSEGRESEGQSAGCTGSPSVSRSVPLHLEEKDARYPDERDQEQRTNVSDSILCQGTV